MRQRGITAILAAGSAAAVLSACAATPGVVKVGNGSNQSSLAPRAELQSATRALNAGSALTATFSLNTTPTALTEIAGPGDDGLTKAQAAALATARVTVEEVAPSGKTLAQVKSDPDAVSTSITVSVGDTAYLSVRSVDGTYYIQVDLKDLLAFAGEPNEYARLSAKVGSYPTFVQDLVAGKWVGLPSSLIKGLQSLAPAFGGTTIPNSKQLLGASTQLQADLYRDVHVTRPSTGATDHLVIHGQLRRLFRDVTTVLGKQLGPLGLGRSAPVGQLPRQAFTADAYVTDGELSKLSIDLGQFDKANDFSLPLQAVFAGTGAPITAPSGATKVSLGDLALLFAGMGGGGPLSGSVWSSASGGGSSAA